MAGADQREVQSAVIIDPAFLGDVVFDAPLVRALRARHPACKIGLVVRPPADAIARAMPGLARVHVFDKKRADRGWPGLRRVAAELAAEHYELALIPHPSVRSTLLAYLAKIPDRRGTATGFLARAFLTSVRPEQKDDTFITLRLRLLADPLRDPPDLAQTLACRSPSEIRSANPIANEIPSTRESANEIPSKPKIGLVLGSQWPTKRWAPERAAEFVRDLDRTKFDLLLIGSENERPLYRALGPLQGAIDKIGGTVDQLLSTIAGCDLLIAGDTGPLHIARAMGIPVVALFGPTPESKHAFTARDRLLKVDLSCRPCSPHGDDTCPEGHHRCMRELEASRVLTAVTELLERGAR